MAISPFDPVSVALDIFGVVFLVALLYYASKTLFLMRRGKLEKSWRYVSVAVIISTLGVLLFILSMSVSPSFSMRVMWTASTVMLVGTFFLILGFRSHYRVWSGYEFEDEKKNRIEP